MPPNREIVAELSRPERSITGREKIVQIYWLPLFSGYGVHFPHRTDLSPKLHALSDHVRAMRRGQA